MIGACDGAEDKDWSGIWWFDATCGWRKDDLSFTALGPSRQHSGGANIAFCDGHFEYGKYRKWVEHRNDVRGRWNRDHQPHPDSGR